MKTSSPRANPLPILCPPGLASGLLLLWLVSLPRGLQAQSDNFNRGNDTGWTRYDALGGLGAGPQATFTFPNGGYRLRATKNPALPDEVGPARAGSLRQDVSYSDFYVAVDVVNWDATVRQAFGILARVSTPGLGTTAGYAFTYELGSGVTATSGDLDISRIDGESPTGVPTGPSGIHLQSGKSYRFVFIGKGPALEGRIYSLSDLTTPLISISGSDGTYATGTAGLTVYDNNGTDGRINPDATFDNYLATDVEPPSLTATLDVFNDAVICWSDPARAFLLQGAATLPTTNWVDIPGPYDVSGDTLCHTEDASTGIRFFRLKR